MNERPEDVDPEDDPVLTNTGVQLEEVEDRINVAAKELAAEFGFTTVLIMGIVGEDRRQNHVLGISGSLAEAVFAARHLAGKD